MTPVKYEIFILNLENDITVEICGQWGDPQEFREKENKVSLRMLLERKIYCHKPQMV
jgi:hypothetical protein